MLDRGRMYPPSSLLVVPVLLPPEHEVAKAADDDEATDGQGLDGCDDADDALFSGSPAMAAHAFIFSDHMMVLLVMVISTTG
nr:unnamed protein product [Digitaria exilis]